GEALMARAGGKHGDVSGFELEYLSFVAAEAHPGLAARNAKRLVRGRVIVHIIVNAVAPRAAPTVALEQGLEYRRGIARFRQRHRAAIMNEGEFRIVRNGSVVGKHGPVRHTLANA